MSMNNVGVRSLIDNFSLSSVVEVGVWKGELSFYLLDSCPSIKEYFMVDPLLREFNDIPEKDYKCTMGRGIIHTQDELDEMYKLMMERVNKDDTVSFIRKTSQEAVSKFEDDSLDLVFIDSIHLYDNLKEDITLWSKKVKNGGFIAGDDYTLQFPGVVRAVEEMFPRTHKVLSGIWISQL